MYELRANLERSAKSYMDLAQLAIYQWSDQLSGCVSMPSVDISTHKLVLSNAIRDELITVVQLYKALGGGWKQ